MRPSAPAARPVLPPFEVTVQSGQTAARQTLKRVLQALTPLGMAAEECGTVELVLAEVLNNIIEHAYPDPLCPGPIHIACHHATDGLHLRVRDSGRPMPEGRAPLGPVQPLGKKVEDLPEGGFGWRLIRDLAKDLSYRRQGNENQLDLRLAVALPV